MAKVLQEASNLSISYRRDPYQRGRLLLLLLIMIHLNSYHDTPYAKYEFLLNQNTINIQLVIEESLSDSEIDFASQVPN